MRTAKSLGLLLCVAISNAALIYGCGSDENTGTGEEPDSGNSVFDKDAGRETGSIVAEEDAQAGTKDAGKDARKDSAKDSNTADVVKDAPPDVVFDPPGSPCGPLSTIQERACQSCGTENRVCLNQLDASAPDSGLPGYWSPWSSCNVPPAAVCDPNQTYVDEACGNCGTRQRVCQVDCTFVTGLTCSNEGVCAPTTSSWEQGLGCNQPLGRKKTCNATCKYDIDQTCSAEPPNPLNIIINNGAVGQQYSKTFTLGRKEKRINVSAFSSLATCPTTLGTTQTASEYVEVKNTTAAAVVVSIWHSKAATTPLDQDTLMAVYAGSGVPKNDAARQACLGWLSDECDPAIGGTLNPKACVKGSIGGAAGILKGDVDNNDDPIPGITIPAASSVTVNLSAFSATATGQAVLNVKVEAP